MDKKIILFELNEVPYRVIDDYCHVNPKSSLAQLLPACAQYETYSEDVSSLSPWKTWPSVHRGVNDECHLLQNFGQDLTEADDEHPPVWKLLTRYGVKTGIFGSLHSYPMPESLENYVFYFPDTFAAGSECFPPKLSAFQQLNLQMVQESARNVSSNIPRRSALKVLADAPALGFKISTFGKIGKQLISERLQNWHKVRRRTYQAVLAFDIFMKQLKSTKPDFATFFTNHVASSMHRFWAARFPDDYDTFEFEDEWVKTYRSEIHFTMSKFDEFFKTLVRFVNRYPEYTLWFCTSMGQAATIAKPLETQLYIADVTRFMKQFGLGESEWDKRPSMLPRYNFYVTESKAVEFRETLRKMVIDGRPVEVYEAANHFFCIRLGHEDLYKKPQYVQLNGQEISFEDMGLINEEIEDKSNTTAYHIPQGSLFIYNPRDQRPKNTRRSQVSTLDIAPTILKNFSVPIPEYMKHPASLGV